MNRQIALVIAIILWNSVLFGAEYFNPFELDPVHRLLGFSCKLILPNHETIKHDCKDHPWVDQQIRQARLQKKYLIIHLENLTQIITNTSARVYASDAITQDIHISDQPLAFEYLMAAKKTISPCRRMGGMFYEYRCFLIQNDQFKKEILLTEQQGIFLNYILAKKNIKRLRINLSALRRISIYEEFLEPNEVIIPELLDIN